VKTLKCFEGNINGLVLVRGLEQLQNGLIFFLNS